MYFVIWYSRGSSNPTSKIDAELVLSEVGVEPASYATVKRRLPSYAQLQWRQALAAASARGIPDRVIYYQFRRDRVWRTLRGIDEQICKAERAVDGHAPVKRNRHIQLSGAAKSVNRTLEAKTRALAGWKGYTANLTSASPEFVIDTYHQLWHVGSPSGYPSTTCKPVRSTITCAIPSRPT